MRGTSPRGREAIGATLVYGNFVRPRGYTGRNVTIAVIDSGIDAAYPGVRGRLVLSKDFTGTGTGDNFGHGTHIVDIIAGEDHGGNFGGVAPDARIISLKVLQADGSGKTSDVIAALDWVRQNRDRYNIRVVNVSLGHPVFESYQDDPLAQAAQRVIDAGLVVVASAGNYGKVKVDGEDVPVFGGIASPGNLPDIITVGALNTFGTVSRKDDSVATYSSKGPSAFDKVLKPDLVAPGNKLWAYMAAGTTVPGGIVPPEYLSTAPDGSPLIAMSGTSESAGVVWMAKNGPSPKVAAALIGDDEIAGSGV